MAKRLDDTEDRPPTHRHPEVEAAELETAPNVAPLELHQGARRYYDEQAKT